MTRIRTRYPVLLLSTCVIAALLLLHPTIALAASDGTEFAKYEQRGWLWMFLGAFGFGFLTSLTPCVYPMIPITLGVFGARGKDVSRAKALALATAYVFGMGLTYAILGVTVTLVVGPKGFGTLLANPWVVIPVVLLFTALALSMFGLYDLNLPSSLQAKLNSVGGSGFGGAFAMGLVGGFIAAPCTGPFLGGLLAFVASTGNAVGGGALLFVYALGMGVLFWVLAAFAMSLPKSGRWMDWAKSIGGIMLLIGALYFLKPLLPFMRTFASPQIWFLVGSIVTIAAGLALGSIHLSFHGSLFEKLRKALGIVAVLAGAFSVWGWTLAPKHHLPWIRGDEAGAFAAARTAHKGVMVDFSATWCNPCEALEKTFGSDETYPMIIENFVPLKFDVSELNDSNQLIRDKYGATTLPSVIFMDSEGRVLGRVREEIDPDELVEVLTPAIAKLKASIR
jgi:thioredoxin:protein disulfide reductase